jgi:hypothetical protein
VNGIQELIAAERARYERAPMHELRNVRLALSIGSWGNTLEEKARLEAVDMIVHDRLARRMKERVA